MTGKGVAGLIATGVICFAGGAFLGGLYMKGYYEQRANEDVESVKRVYKEKYGKEDISKRREPVKATDASVDETFKRAAANVGTHGSSSVDIKDNAEQIARRVDKRQQTAHRYNAMEHEWGIPHEKDHTSVAEQEAIDASEDEELTDEEREELGNDNPTTDFFDNVHLEDDLPPFEIEGGQFDEYANYDVAMFRFYAPNKCIVDETGSVLSESRMEEIFGPKIIDRMLETYLGHVKYIRDGRNKCDYEIEWVDGDYYSSSDYNGDGGERD